MRDTDGYWARFAERRTDRRRLLRAVGGMALTGAAFSLIGCGSDDDGGADDSGKTASASGTPRRGGRFGWWVVSSANFNVVSNITEGNNLSGGHVYDHLISSRMDDRQYILAAADKVETPDDKKVIFKLKSNLNYRNEAPVNGRAVKASDVVAVQEYVKALPAADNSAFQREIMDRVEAPDDNTVVFTLKTPSAYLFTSSQLGNSVSMGIIPQELLPNLDTAKPVGSGPYYLDEYTLNSRYLYKRNEGWREAAKGLPYLDEREMFILSDAVAQEAAFRSGQLHRWDPPVSIADRVVQDVQGFATAQTFESLAGFQFALNMDATTRQLPWQKDVRVREALYRLTDRDQHLSLTFAGKGKVSPGPIPTGFTDYQLAAKDTDAYYKLDKTQAKQLLDAAQFPYDKEWELITSSTTQTAQQSSEILSQQWAPLGIKLRPKALPLAEWLSGRVTPGSFDLALTTFTSYDTPQQAIRMHHSNTNNRYAHTGLYDASVDALIQKSETVTDYDELVKLVKQIQIEVLKKYSGWDNLVTQNVVMLLNAKVKDYEYAAANAQWMPRTELWLDA